MDDDEDSDYNKFYEDFKNYESNKARITKKAALMKE